MKVCCVFNYNPLYRYPIFSAIADNFDCDFYFGDTVFQPLKAFDATKLKGFKHFIYAKKTGVKAFIWHSQIKDIFRKEYTHYILTGEAALLVNWLIIFYARLTGRKVFGWTHGAKDYPKNWRRRWLMQAFYRPLSGILMYNRYNCQYMEALGCKKERLFVIHNSLDSAVQTKIYQSLAPSDIYQKHFGNSNPTLIYIGRIQRVKKVDMILEAMKLLEQQGKLVNLVVVGANVDDDSFEKRIEELKLSDRVWMYGPCFDEQTNSELIYNAAACVSPGNIGLTCIHVLSYGTPVITNDNFNTQMPEFEAVVEGKTGSFFRENNVEDLADKIAYWTSITEQQRDECRSVARQTIEQEWSVDYQIDLLKKVLV